MKKGIIISVLLASFLLSSCFTSQDDVNEAKKELGIIEQTNNGGEINTLEKNDVKNVEDGGILEINNKDIIDEKEEIFEVNYLSDNKFLELDDLSNIDLQSGEIEISGKALINVDKIVVNFSNKDSSFPNDSYTLNKFKSGDETFLYRAFSRYETFDYGVNSYIFIAYAGDEISKLELIINNIKEEEIKKEELQNIYNSEASNIGSSDSSFLDFPVSETFGTPVDLGEGKISYSDLKGLEIIKEINKDLTCENLTSFLADKINGWFFWNTCREIEKDKGISYFVIRLDGEEYVYEKHYYLSEKGVYGIQELERGIGVKSENISTKNSELKKGNDDYSILDVVDDLFVEIGK